MPIKDFQVGAPLTAADLNTYLLQQSHVIKLADESVTSSTTLQNDDHLVLPVTANTRYWVQAMIIYTGGSNGDLRYTFTGPTGASFDWVGDHLGEGVDSTTGIISRTVQSIGASNVIAGAVTGATQVALPKGILIVGSSSGTLRLRWAQGTSSSTPTTVKAGSILMARRITD